MSETAAGDTAQGEGRGIIRGRLAIWIVLPWAILLFLKMLESWAFLRLQGEVFAFGELLRRELPIAVVGVLVTPWALWLGFRLPITRATWRRHLPLLAAAALATVPLMNVARSGLWMLLGTFPPGLHTLRAGSLMGITTVFHIDLINVVFIIAVGHLLFVLRDRQDKALRAARLEGQLAETRLHVLQSKIQPHFLFNALHTIGQLVRAQRGPEAMHVVERLGQLLRSALEERPPLIALSEEIEFARAYLEIESIRFSDRLRVHWEVHGEDVLRAAVPALLLQPVLENAIRHGIAPHSDAGHLTIRVERDGARLTLQVEDDGHGFRLRPGTAGTGLGLRNTRERLAAAFGDAARMDTEDLPGRGARVTIRMPFTAAIVPARTTAAGAA